LLPENSEVNDYRPVLNAEGRTVIFERNATATPNDVKLYSADLSTGNDPKWFPPRKDGKTLLIVAVQAGPSEPFRIATLNVSRFVSGTTPSNSSNQRE
jgi:hypothetical protein